ncbi:MAG: hypothetical protein KAG97_03200 [Victivallales bacterium]|nr:hypothetical protein [Victivallales bacterium]
MMKNSHIVREAENEYLLRHVPSSEEGLKIIGEMHEFYFKHGRKGMTMEPELTPHVRSLIRLSEDFRKIVKMKGN